MPSLRESDPILVKMKQNEWKLSSSIKSSQFSPCFYLPSVQSDSDQDKCNKNDEKFEELTVKWKARPDIEVLLQYSIQWLSIIKLLYSSIQNFRTNIRDKTAPSLFFALYKILRRTSCPATPLTNQFILFLDFSLDTLVSTVNLSALGSFKLDLV